MQRHHHNKKKAPRCKYGSKCKYGRECRFSHSSEASRTSRAACKNGDECPFLGQGTCKFFHPTGSSEESEPSSPNSTHSLLAYTPDSSERLQELNSIKVSGSNSCSILPPNCQHHQEHEESLTNQRVVQQSSREQLTPFVQSHYKNHQEEFSLFSSFSINPSYCDQGFSFFSFDYLSQDSTTSSGIVGHPSTRESMPCHSKFAGTRLQDGLHYETAFDIKYQDCVLGSSS
mmetsp:Transcript_24926/g.45369  ORF Transcript_24926/g.45369 Transcript_24926/m.45369 type:complete len:230 (+) Transcript_24926:82-771(+)